MDILLNYLKDFKGKQGLYIIRPKKIETLKAICEKLNYNYTSDIAYIGKAEITKTSHLGLRSKQEMGWSNFEGATFVKKIGIYLDLDIKDKKNKELREKTKLFICSNFTIECIPLDINENVLIKETEYIHSYKPCLNDMKKLK